MTPVPAFEVTPPPFYLVLPTRRHSFSSESHFPLLSLLDVVIYVLVWPEPNQGSLGLLLLKILLSCLKTEMMVSAFAANLTLLTRGRQPLCRSRCCFKTNHGDVSVNPFQLDTL